MLPGNTRAAKLMLVKDTSPNAYRKARIVYASLVQALSTGINPLVPESSLKNAIQLSRASKTTVETCPNLLRQLREAQAIDAGERQATLTSMNGVSCALIKLKSQCRAWEEVCGAIKDCLKTPVPTAVREAARPSPTAPAGGNGPTRTAARPAVHVPELDDLAWPLASPVFVNVPHRAYTEQELKAA